MDANVNWSFNYSDIETPEKRLEGVIGQIIVLNAKLGYEVETLRRAMTEVLTRIDAETARAETAEKRVKELEAMYATSTPE